MRKKYGPQFKQFESLEHLQQICYFGDVVFHLKTYVDFASPKVGTPDVMPNLIFYYILSFTSFDVFVFLKISSILMGPMSLNTQK